jgi:cellulose synthase/poly-beta-1,6-N-acetylglucosamine synthase-like glycosyltransferase
MTNIGEKKLRLGEILIQNKVISIEQLDEALAIQKEWGSRLGDVLMAKGWVTSRNFYHTLAEHFNMPFVDFYKEPAEPSLLKTALLGQYLEHLVIPFKHKEGQLIVAIADIGDSSLAFAEAQFGKDVKFVMTSKFDIIWHLQTCGKEHFSDAAVHGLSFAHPTQSAKQVFTGRQLIEIGVFFSIMFALLVFWPSDTLIGLNLFAGIFFIINFLFKATLSWVGSHKKVDTRITDQMIADMDDASLPLYTVLIPMYKEADTLPIIAASLRKLDYPKSKLDVKLVLEEDDDETIQAAKNLGLESFFEIIRVPHSMPKTKPKACNYALNFARGKFLTIYDAEDKPEPQQLKKALLTFQHASDDMICVQARLNYFNATENWLTRMFTLEYSIWFDYFLPALDLLRIPIPLGGTSNHFKMDKLREIGLWDPYNVTEDADLGMRITQLGYRVGVVNSTTLEEANGAFGNWIRQRSRWVKGYMQTYLVYMRQPMVTYRTLGHAGFWGFQMFIGGSILMTLMLPFMYAMFIFWLITQSMVLDPYFLPPIVLYLSLFNLLVGNGSLIYISMLGAFKRHSYSLIPYALTSPFYGMLVSIAGYKALWQLVFNPFYWEKTQHGLSSFVHEELDLPENKNAKA